MEAAGRGEHAAAARATPMATQVVAYAPRSRKRETGREEGRGEQTLPRREERSAKQEKAEGRARRRKKILKSAVGARPGQL
jgi:hypothetical protein